MQFTETNYTPYSYSKQESYYSCPNKFKLTYIDKIKGVSENKAFEKGSYVHLFLENKIQPTEKNTKELLDYPFRLLDTSEQKELKELCTRIYVSEYFQKLYRIVSDCDIIGVEQGFSFDKDWNSLNEYKRDKTILISGYIDLMAIKGKTGFVLDYKTGKPKGQYQTYEQAELYALFLLKHYNLDKVKTIYYYVEHDLGATKEYTKLELPVLQNKFTDLLKTIENTTYFKKKVTKLCGWCDYYKSGDCTLTDEEILRVM